MPRFVGAFFGGAGFSLPFFGGAGFSLPIRAKLGLFFLRALLLPLPFSHCLLCVFLRVFASNRSPVPQTFIFSSPCFQLHTKFFPNFPCPHMISSNCREAARTGVPPGPRGRNKFLSWPGYVACAVVLTSCRPLQASRWFPYVEETGGKNFSSN